MGMLEIARRSIGNPERMEDCLNKIQGAAGHLMALINDVLDMAKLESGKAESSMESFELQEILDDCISITEGQLTGRRIEFIKETDYAQRGAGSGKSSSSAPDPFKSFKQCS